MLPSLTKPRQMPRPAPSLEPGGPLWRHVPTRDGEGRPLCDLLLLVPGLRRDQVARDLTAAQLRAALDEFGDRVRFANLNLELGVAWVTVAAEPGLTGVVADAIRRRLPGVRLVGNQLRPPRPRRLGWVASVRALLR